MVKTILLFGTQKFGRKLGKDADAGQSNIAYFKKTIRLRAATALRRKETSACFYVLIVLNF